MPIYRKDGKAVLFVHIPKAGGTTVDRVFRANGWQVSFQDGGGRPDSLLRHLRCSFQHYHGALLAEVLNLQSFDAVFCLLRDPMARLQSEYRWRRQARAAAQRRPMADFDSWSRQMLRSYRRNPYLLDNHIRPQSAFVLPGAQATALEDGLAAALRPLEARLGMRLEYDAGLAENATAPDPALSVSPRTAWQVRRFYRRDYALHRRLRAAGAGQEGGRGAPGAARFT